jgi:hypothetical protein
MYCNKVIPAVAGEERTLPCFAAFCFLSDPLQRFPHAVQGSAARRQTVLHAVLPGHCWLLQFFPRLSNPPFKGCTDQQGGCLSSGSSNVNLLL